ncbi:MAG: lysophospholipid acyltransferase family protein [Helicobacter sp.]|nr:lysophospholipid acyltransferase family protein [Helicobacter sp.]
MQKIRGIWASLVIIFGLAIIILLILSTRHKGQNGRKARFGCKFWFFLSGFKLEQIGSFDMEANLILLNHQSYADIICLEGYHPRNICWVAKKQLGKIPFYGHALKGPEMILVDRESRTGLAFLLKEAKKRLEQNRPLTIFPEGTRSDGKEQFLKFKVGAKILAERYKLKIQPVLLINTRKMFQTSPMKSEISKARMVALDAFYPDLEDPNWYDKLEVQMQAEYLKHYRELNPTH